MNVVYSKPRNSDICIAFCYYNPSGDPAILQNTIAFESKLKVSNIPFFSIELIEPGSKPVLQNPTLLVEASSKLLYKESLWNLLEPKIPYFYTKICFMDTNLEYKRADWLDCVSLLLNFYDIIQPYNKVNLLDISGNLVKTVESAIKSGNIEDNHGNAWAVNREFLRKIGGFYTKSVIYPSSIFSSLTATGPIEIPVLENDFSSYSMSIKAKEARVKYLNTEVNHFFNGRVYDYSSLNTIVKSITKSWDILFTLNKSGLWELNDITLNSEIKDIFSGGLSEPVVIASEEIPVIAPMEHMASVAPMEPIAPVAPVAPVSRAPPMFRVARAIPPSGYRSGTPPMLQHLRAGKKNDTDRSAAATLIARFKKN